MITEEDVVIAKLRDDPLYVGIMHDVPALAQMLVDAGILKMLSYKIAHPGDVWDFRVMYDIRILMPVRQIPEQLIWRRYSKGSLLEVDDPERLINKHYYDCKAYHVE